MQIVSSGDTLHEMSTLIFWREREKKKEKKLSICRLLNLPISW